MPGPDSFGWTDIDDIAINLFDAHPGIDPLSLRFTEMREMVENLPNFEADPDHHVNEQILEAIQAAWLEEIQDADDRDEDDPTYTPNNPYR